MFTRPVRCQPASVHEIFAELARTHRLGVDMNVAVPRPAPPRTGADERAAGALLTVDLAAIAFNYRLLRSMAAPAACGAVVKADAYGLGAAMVVPALFGAGCRHFFVAHLDEALAIHRVVPRGAGLYVMHGVFDGGEADCAAHGIVPVSNSPAQLQRWAAQARRSGRRLPAVLQIDTGMARFGFAPADLVRARDQLEPLALTFIMSHLACADTPDHPANIAQRIRFDAARAHLPPAPGTLAASSGIFLGADFHYDLVRPGAALYGIAPNGLPNPLRPVVRLDAKVVQVRHVPAGTPIGYGHTAVTAAPARLATIAVGYADGYLRSGSNHGAAWLGETALPVMGRISMDSIVLDASDLPQGAVEEADMVELIGPHRGVDAVAADAGTIGYEVLTSLGRRYHRRYLEAGTIA